MLRSWQGEYVPSSTHLLMRPFSATKAVCQEAMHSCDYVASSTERWYTGSEPQKGENGHAKPGHSPTLFPRRGNATASMKRQDQCRITQANRLSERSRTMPELTPKTSAFQPEACRGHGLADYH